MSEYANGYRVEKPLVLNVQMHRLPLKPEIVAMAGLDPHAPPNELLLAQIIISAAQYDGQWRAYALIDDITIGSISCTPGTARGDVLRIVEDWIRHSDCVGWVPGQMNEIEVKPSDASFMALGVILVRMR